MPKRLTLLTALLALLTLQNVWAAVSIWSCSPSPLELGTGPAGNEQGIASAVRFAIALGFGIAAMSLALPKCLSFRRAAWAFGITTGLSLVLLVVALGTLLSPHIFSDSDPNENIAVIWRLSAVSAFLSLNAVLFYRVICTPKSRAWLAHQHSSAVSTT